VGLSPSSSPQPGSRPIEPTGGGRRQVAAAFLVALVGLMPVFLTGALSVQMRRSLGFGDVGLGVATGIFFLSAGLASVVLGRVVERRGIRFGFVATAVGSAVMLLGLATARSWLWLVVALALAGTVNAFAQPSANTALATSRWTGSRGTLFGLKQSSVPAATLLAGLAVPVIALTVGWRWAFAAAIVLPLVLLVVVSPLPGVAPAARPERGRVRPRDEPAARRARRAVRLTAVGSGVGSMTGNGGTAFLVPAAVDAGLAEASAGLLLGVISVFGIGTRIGVGWIANRMPQRRMSYALGILVVSGLGYAVIASAAPGLLPLGAFFALGVGWAWPSLVHWDVSTRDLTRTATSTGTLQTGVFLGAGSGPVLFGLVAARTSYAVGFLGCAVLTLVAAGLLWAGRSRDPGAPEAATVPDLDRKNRSDI
jgi:MFS family permease